MAKPTQACSMSQSLNKGNVHEDKYENMTHCNYYREFCLELQALRDS